MIPDLSHLALRTTTAALAGGTIARLVRRDADDAGPDVVATAVAAGAYAVLVTVLAERVHPAFGLALGDVGVLRPARDVVEPTPDYEAENEALVMAAGPVDDEPTPEDLGDPSPEELRGSTPGDG
ncbi:MULTISPECIES: hypothetical protein [unclassified Isoptericola]|uniref:hypothetical protein n=1 Tax=unclassified Isoptericola TaxID=2623355 RepID=UPI002713D2B9|nr:MULTISPECIES: hypothetical protein [unclassified Isoptericola]MDO8144896.1 hypothetical protein [Isoptericola sp. 178]MDO8152610.1 hypothetical protein [Isoptericola sp. b408]